MYNKLNAWPLIGPIKIESDAESLAQEVFVLSHYAKGITQDLVVQSRNPCLCSNDQLHGYGESCAPCVARRDLNRATRQFKQSKKLAGY